MSIIDEPVAFVDVETTGGHPAWHRITEIAIVAMRDGEIEWQWSSLVNPGVSIPPSIQRLTGISNEMVSDAPSFEELAAQIHERLAGRRFVAHNVRFDYGFVRAEMRRAGRDYRAPLACTVRLSRELFPDAGRHNLDALIARHGLQCEARHRALPDALVLADLWRCWRSELDTEVFAAAIEHVARRPALPPQLSPELIDDLPEGSGVYRFHAEGGALLYIGKAKNIRERVLAHFTSANRDSKSQRLREQTYRVEWTETAGEFSALLLEARLVRELQPVYNRRLRGGSPYFTWMITEGAAPTLVALQGPLPRDKDCFGLFQSERLARKALTELARERRFCLKLLGLESGGAGSCFAHQIGRCSGACVGSESATKHYLRLKLAWVKQKLQTWPYDSAVRVEERNAAGLVHHFDIDGWQILREPMVKREGFDPDVYRILVRFLRVGRGRLRIGPVPGDYHIDNP